MNESPSSMARATRPSRADKISTTKLVSELGPFDVLLGRGTGANENQGNKFFRGVLRKFKGEYQAATSRKEKKATVLKALHEIRSKGGKFVAKNVFSSGGNRDQFEVVDDATAFLKTRQAFRYVLQESTSNKEQDSKPNSSPIQKDGSSVGTPKISQQQRADSENEITVQAPTASTPQNRGLAFLDPQLTLSHSSPNYLEAALRARQALIGAQDRLSTVTDDLVMGRTSSLQSSLQSRRGSFLLQSLGAGALSLEQERLAAQSILARSNLAQSTLEKVNPSNLLLAGPSFPGLTNQSNTSRLNMERVLLNSLSSGNSLHQILAQANSISQTAIAEQLALKRLLLEQQKQAEAEESSRAWQRSPSLLDLPTGMLLKNNVKLSAIPPPQRRHSTNLYEIMSKLPGDKGVFHKKFPPTHPQPPGL